MPTQHGVEGFEVLKGGSATSKAHALNNPTANAFLLPELSALVVGLRLVKASVKQVFMWDRLYMEGGCNTAFWATEVVDVFSDTTHSGVGVRLVRGDA